MAQTYRDPTFEEVAAREARALRDAVRSDERSERAKAKRMNPHYTEQRRRKIARLVRMVMVGTKPF